MIWKHWPIRVVLMAAAMAGWFGGARAAGYQTAGTCGGFPDVMLQTLPDLCVGLVAKGLGFARGADGRPTGTPEPLIWGWDGRGGKTPSGSPVGVAEMADGSVLITEDHNGTLLRLARK